MKILHILSSLDPQKGGVSQAVRLIITGLSRLGVESEVLTVDSPESAYLKNENFLIFAMGPSVTPWAYSKKIIKWQKQNLTNYNLVIVHGLWHYQVYSTYRTLSRLKGAIPKLYVMPHGMLDPYFQKAPERKFKAFRNKIFWSFFERKLINTADGVLFTCEIEKELAHQSFSNYKPKRETVVGLGIESPPSKTYELSQVFISKFPQLCDREFFLFLSRIDQKKGVDMLIKAYKHISKNKKSIPALVIAGPGLDSEYGFRMKALADDLNFDIYFTGMLVGDMTWSAFYNSSVFVLPSHQENFGLAIVEALSCKKPVLITDKVNIWHEIYNGGAGCVETDNLTGVICLLEGWMKKTLSEKREMSKNVETVFQTHFLMKESSLKLYNELMRN